MSVFSSILIDNLGNVYYSVVSLAMTVQGRQHWYNERRYILSTKFVFFLFFSRIRFSNKPKIRMTSEDEWHRVLVKTKQIQLSVKGLALILRAFTSARRPTIRQEINIKYIVSAQWVRELYFLHRFQKGLFKPIYQMSFFFSFLFAIHLTGIVAD